MQIARVLDELFGEWLDRMLGNKVRWRLENAGWLRVFQVGFRKGQGVNDHLISLTQAVCGTDTDDMRKRVQCCTILSERLTEYGTMGGCGS